MMKTTVASVRRLRQRLVNVGRNEPPPHRIRLRVGQLFVRALRNGGQDLCVGQIGGFAQCAKRLQTELKRWTRTTRMMVFTAGAFLLSQGPLEQRHPCR